MLREGQPLRLYEDVQHPRFFKDGQPPGSTRIASPPDSTRMFRPAGSEAITIHNLDVENNRGWGRSYQFADALCIGPDEQKRVMVDLWNYTEVGTGRMVLIFYISGTDSHHGDALCIG